MEDNSDAEEELIIHVFEGGHSAENVHISEQDMIHVYVLNSKKNFIVASCRPNCKVRRLRMKLADVTGYKVDDLRLCCRNRRPPSRGGMYS